MLNSSFHSHCLSTFPDANLMLAVPCKYQSLVLLMPTQMIRQPSTIFLTSRKWGIPDDFLAIPCIEALPSLNSKGIVKSPQ